MEMHPRKPTVHRKGNLDKSIRIRQQKIKPFFNLKVIPVKLFHSLALACQFYNPYNDDIHEEFSNQASLCPFCRPFFSDINRHFTGWVDVLHPRGFIRKNGCDRLRRLPPHFTAFLFYRRPATSPLRPLYRDVHGSIYHPALPTSP